ncbi:MAG: DUF4838 domain-containing protein [Armatimonadota bacterium]
MPDINRSEQPLKICCLGSDRTVIYAADELNRCLSQMIKSKINEDVKGFADEDINNSICVGLFSAMPFVQVPSVADPNMDDAIVIDVRSGKGYITGINPRSVLLAVYRYLTELGCRWVRPGADGEYIPELTNLPDVHVSETPSYRHRGVCIEGAVSYEHVRDMVEWIPKTGFNGYFTQFREAHTFFDRWYSHQGNPLMEGHPLSIEDARKYTASLVEEIRKRGLLYHAVGHGWTCEPFGIPGLGWDDRVYDVPEESVQYLAQVNGVRELWYGVPLNTNLCYSNPKVREIVTDEIVRYAGDNPAVDILHFWLADGSNNNCECDECVKARPSDFYVQMLNLLDEKLTEKNIDTKIVFLIYVDLLWEPIQDRIENPDRFILMFAPITRTYSHSFETSDKDVELPPYNRNKLEFPRDVDISVGFLKAWQKQFPGDSFDFDYHLMWDHYNDPGHIYISDMINQDMKALRDIGLNGYVSCQVQRVFLPTGLPMVAMGRTLWNTALGFDEIASDYFNSAFGPDGAKCRAYLEKVSELFDPVYLRGEKPGTEVEAAVKFHAAQETIKGFIPVIEKNQACENPCWRKSWEYLRHHADIYTLLAKAHEARALGDVDGASYTWNAVTQLVREREPILHPVLDVQLFQQVTGGKLRLG